MVRPNPSCTLVLFRLSDRLAGCVDMILGVLSCLDGYMNIALEQTEEHVNGAVTNRYGDAFIRGNNGGFASLTFWVPLIAGAKPSLLLSSSINPTPETKYVVFQCCISRPRKCYENFVPEYGFYTFLQLWGVYGEVPRPSTKK